MLVMVVGDWFRIAQMSHMPFWEGQFVFVKHILEGGRLFGPCTSIVTVFFRFPASIPLTFTSSLQNRRDFLRISRVQGRKRGEREARVARTCEPPLVRNSRLPRLRPCSPEIRKKSRLFCRLFYLGSRDNPLPFPYQHPPRLYILHVRVDKIVMPML